MTGLNEIRCPISRKPVQESALRSKHTARLESSQQYLIGGKVVSIVDLAKIAESYKREAELEDELLQQL